MDIHGMPQATSVRHPSGSWPIQNFIDSLRIRSSFQKFSCLLIYQVEGLHEWSGWNGIKILSVASGIQYSTHPRKVCARTPTHVFRLGVEIDPSPLAQWPNCFQPCGILEDTVILEELVFNQSGLNFFAWITRRGLGQHKQIRMFPYCISSMGFPLWTEAWFMKTFWNMLQYCSRNHSTNCSTVGPKYFRVQYLMLHFNLNRSTPL